MKNIKEVVINEELIREVTGTLEILSDMEVTKEVLRVAKKEKALIDLKNFDDEVAKQLIEEAVAGKEWDKVAKLGKQLEKYEKATTTLIDRDLLPQELGAIITLELDIDSLKVLILEVSRLKKLQEAEKSINLNALRLMNAIRKYEDLTGETLDVIDVVRGR